MRLTSSQDYQEHQNEIHAKLVAIMSDRLSVHVGSLRGIDWEAAPAKDGPRPYAEMLVKETATLHKVLSKYLAPQTVESVMSEVLAAIVHRLSDEYAKIELKSDDAKKRMTQDVALVAARLVPLAEAGKNVASLETLVKDKPLPRKPMGQAVAGFLKRGNSKDESKGAAGPDDMGVTGEKQDEDEVEDEDGESLGVIPDQVDSESKPEAPVDDQVQGDGEEALAAPPAVETPALAAAAPPVIDADADDAPTPDIRNPPPSSPGPSAPAIPEGVPSPAAPERITSPPIPERLTSPGIPERIASPIPIIRSSLERLRSPSPGPQSPFTERITSPMSSPSPTGFGSPTGRAPRVSLANRLRGVVTRAGSEPRDELMSPPPPPKDVVQELPPTGAVSPSEPVANGGTSGEPQQPTTEVKESEKDGEASVLAVNGVEPAASQPLFEAPLDDLASPAPPPPEKDMPAEDESDDVTKPDPTETELTGTQAEHEGEGSAVPGSAEPQVTSHETEQEAQPSGPDEDGGKA
jgi:vacuolar protein sorting-associated protein 54